MKAIIEYRKVADELAGELRGRPALLRVRHCYLALGEPAKAREALEAVAKDYPTSPLAGTALFVVGKSYEDEADRLATSPARRRWNRPRTSPRTRPTEQSQDNRRKQLEACRADFRPRKAGLEEKAEVEEASQAGNYGNSTRQRGSLRQQGGPRTWRLLTATQLADRQDKINAALRNAVDAYTAASKVPGGNKADAALLQMATIYDQRLKDSKAAMETWLEIVRQFSGTAVAEDASWKLAQYLRPPRPSIRQGDRGVQLLPRNYRRSPNAGAAQFAVAECYEHLGQWVDAMDCYTSYMNNFADGPLVGKANEQINWIKTYRL